MNANAQTYQSEPQLTSEELLEAMTRGNSGENYFQVLAEIKERKKGVYYPPAQPKPVMKCESYNSYGTVYTTCE